jgi:hypothetical protein
MVKRRETLRGRTLCTGRPQVLPPRQRGAEAGALAGAADLSS